MDISDRIARILGFQQIQLVEKDALIEQLQAKIKELEPEKKEARTRLDRDRLPAASAGMRDGSE